MKRQGIAEALRDGIAEEMTRDSSVFCIGEDIGVPGGWGGAFTVTLGLSEKFPGRIIDTPIAELGFTGMAVGAAMMGMRPIADMVARARLCELLRLLDVRVAASREEALHALRAMQRHRAACVPAAVHPRGAVPVHRGNRHGRLRAGSGSLGGHAVVQLVLRVRVTRGETPARIHKPLAV